MNRRELTPRESAVTALVAQGLTNAEIAQRLGISVSTTKQNLASILIKWNCANRTQVAVEAARRGLDAPVPASETSITG